MNGDPTDLVEQAEGLKQQIASVFPDAITDLTLYPSGAVMLDVRRRERLFVLSFAPSSGWFGVDEIVDGDGIGDQYRFGSRDFAAAREKLLSLLLDAA